MKQLTICLFSLVLICLVVCRFFRQPQEERILQNDEVFGISEHLRQRAIDLEARANSLAFSCGWQKAKISWYGNEFHGRKTKSGETFDQWGFSCACNFLPPGTWVIFYNPTNQKFAMARITDTGNFEKYNRKFDVSRQVAETLDIVEKGVVEIYWKRKTEK